MIVLASPTYEVTFESIPGGRVKVTTRSKETGAVEENIEQGDPIRVCLKWMDIAIAVNDAVQMQKAPIDGHQ